jgi:large subunit ribosomal protein L3
MAQGPRNSNEKYHSLQLGSTNIEARKHTEQMQGHFIKHGITPKHKLESFQVSPEAVLPVGTTLSAAHFVPGQFVDVTSKT